MKKTFSLCGSLNNWDPPFLGGIKLDANDGPFWIDFGYFEWRLNNLQGTKISPFKGTLELIFRTSPGGICEFPGG